MRKQRTAPAAWALGATAMLAACAGAQAPARGHPARAPHPPRVAARGHSGAQAQAATPKPGSAERRAIMDSLRVPVERQLKQKVIFVVSKLKVERGFAFVMARPQQPNGKWIDYGKTQYAEAVRAGAFDDQAVGLLKRQGNRWRVLASNLGATDVVWDGWDRKYGAPAAIFK